MFTRAAAFCSSSVIFISWFLLAIALGLAGAYRAAPDRIPTIEYGYPRLVDLAAAMGKGQVETPCPMFGSPCASAWHVRNCLPTCHLQPRLEYAPT
jgi:hypothetical protein